MEIVWYKVVLKFGLDGRIPGVIGEKLYVRRAGDRTPSLWVWMKLNRQYGSVWDPDLRFQVEPGEIDHEGRPKPAVNQAVLERSYESLRRAQQPHSRTKNVRTYHR